MKLIKFFLVLILLLFPFGQLTRIHSGIAGVNLYLQDLVIGALFFYWLIDHLIKRKPFPKPPSRLPILGFILVGAFSLLINLSRLNSSELLISFLYLLRWSVYAGIYFIVYETTLKHKSMKTQESRLKVEDPRHKMSGHKNKILNLLIWAGIMIAVFGLLQYFLYPNLRNLYYLGWDPHQYRIFGTFLDPGFTGVILVLTLILLLCFKTLKQNLRIGGAVLVFLALLLTYSRSSYLAMTAAIIVLVWFKKNLKFLLLPFLLLLFIVAASILPRPSGEGVKLERTSTVSARVKNYQQTLKIIRDNPVFGVGFNSLRFVKRDYDFLKNEDWQEAHSGAGADSSLLFVLATTGVVGLGVYLWMWVAAISKMKNEKSKTHIKYKKYKNITRKPVNICVFTIIAALFIHSLFLNSLFYPWVMVWTWVFLGTNHSENR